MLSVISSFSVDAGDSSDDELESMVDSSDDEPEAAVIVDSSDDESESEDLSSDSWEELERKLWERISGGSGGGSGGSGGAGKLFGGGSGEGQQEAVVAVTPQKGTKRKSEDSSDGAVVALDPSPGSGSARKAQRTLESLWGKPGPQVAVHRSPDHLLKSEKWQKEQALREQLAREQLAKLPGEWLEPVAALPHSGGQRGGRTASGPVRGVAAGFKSNARQLGQSVLRRDPSLSFKLSVITKVEQAASDPTSLPGVVRREIERECGFEWQSIRKWCQRKAEFQSEFTRLRLGKHGLRPFGSSLPATKRQSKSSGARLRKKTVNYQTSVLQQLKQWFDRERMHGHEVTTSLLKDFYVKFLERQAAVCKAQLIHIGQQTSAVQQSAAASGWGSGGAPLQQEDKQLALQQCTRLKKQQKQLTDSREKLEDRIEKMTKSSRKQQDKYFQSVIVAIGAHLRKPGRKTRLSASQEALRVLLTWQSYDRAQYVATQGTDEELLEQVRDPEQWRSNLTHTVWAFWDHVPVWLKVTGDSRVLFSEHERTNEQQRRRLSRKSRDASNEIYAALVSPDPDSAVAQAHQHLLQLAKDATEAAKNQKSDRPVQTRGVYSAAGDKYRVTAILFQSVEQWFDPEKEPCGQARIRSQKDPALAALHGVLIIRGKSHCRLEDISPGGKWLRDVQYKVGGKVIRRVKGQSAGNCMIHWRKLRDQLGPERFQSLRVWSQPAAWADEVISMWVSDLVQSYLIQSINVVDCFSGQWTEACLWNSWLNQQFQVPNGPDTTPLLQLADTCCIAVGKVAGEHQKELMALQCLEKSKREKTQYKAQFGPFELFSVAEAVVQEPQKRQSDHDIILGQCMKSQLLVVRPDARGLLQPVEEQEWAARPVGSSGAISIFCQKPVVGCTHQSQTGMS